MKIAPIAELTPPTAASWIAEIGYPFLSATSAANVALINRATCNGPSAAPVPNSAIVSASNTTKTTTGASASASDGSRGAGARIPGAGGVDSSAIAGLSRPGLRAQALALRPAQLPGHLGGQTAAG